MPSTFPTSTCRGSHHSASQLRTPTSRTWSGRSPRRWRRRASTFTIWSTNRAARWPIRSSTSTVLSSQRWSNRYRRSTACCRCARFLRKARADTTRGAMRTLVSCGRLIFAVLVFHATLANAELWGYMDDGGVAHFATHRVDERYQLFFRGATSLYAAATHPAASRAGRGPTAL